MSKQDKKDKDNSKSGKKDKQKMTKPTENPTNALGNDSDDKHKTMASSSLEAKAIQSQLPINEIPEETPNQPPLSNEELIMFRKLMNAMCGCNNTQDSTTGSGGERIVYKDRIVEKPVEVIKYVDNIVEKEVIKTVERIVEKLPNSVNPMLDIVSVVKQDEELNRQWLDNINDQGLQLIKLTAILSQWDQIDRLWDKLASRCKNDKRPPSAQEKQLLEKAVETYNLTLNSRQASLATGELGGSYDYEKQQRGLPTGDKVVAEWLPALVNAAGTVVKKPLVETR
jgi:hypothetical protein